MSWLGLGDGDLDAAFWTILTAMVANASCAILGCYLVLRRLSLLGDAISHSVLPGIAVAYLVTGSIAPLPMFIGAVIAGITTTFLTELVRSRGNVAEDASMGVVFTSLFAIGVILVRRYANNAHLDDCLVAGDILYVTLDTTPIFGVEVPVALGSLSAILVLTVIFVTVFWKELKIVSFDSALATAMGIPASVVHYLLMGMVGGASVAAFEAVGPILAIAMLIVPAATGQLLADRLGWMMLWAVVVSSLSAILGYFGAVWLNTSVAGMMAVSAGGLFGLAVLLAPRHGIVSKMIHNWRLSLRIVGEDILAALFRRDELANTEGAVPPNIGRQFFRPKSWLAFADLWRLGLVEFGLFPRRLTLTTLGRRRARSIVRAHRLWERYLGENFDLPLDHLHEAAERIEHFIGPMLQDQISDSLQFPDLDPHGRPIPPASSLDRK